MYNAVRETDPDLPRRGPRPSVARGGRVRRAVRGRIDTRRGADVSRKRRWSKEAGSVPRDRGQVARQVSRRRREPRLLPLQTRQVIFVDTGAWIAILQATDPYHERARAYYQAKTATGARFVT